MAKSKPKLGTYFHPTTYRMNRLERLQDYQQEENQELREENQELRALIERRPDNPAIATPSKPTSKTLFPGKCTALARKVKADFDAGQIPWVPTLTAALRWAIQEGYELTNGRTTTPESLAAILYRDKKREEGNVEYF